jgi:hypothetical protein
LCWMQRQRYWVERCFEDGKSQCGMADCSSPEKTDT